MGSQSPFLKSMIVSPEGRKKRARKRGDNIEFVVVRFERREIVGMRG